MASTLTARTASQEPQTLSPRRRVWTRFARDRRAWFGTVALVIIGLGALLAPVIAPYGPAEIDMTAFQMPPSREHLLGTDSVGRDVFSRFLYGARVSLLISLVAVTINVAVGTLLGAIAGYHGGMLDQIIMRLSDAVLSFPLLILVIVAVAIMGPGLMKLIVVIGLMGWPTTCRIVRSQVLAWKNEEFVTAAVALGATTPRLLGRHILPNIVAPIIVTATFDAASVVLLEGSLSFLGLGVQPPNPSWGNMLSDAQSIVILESMPWLWLPPGLAIAITVLALNFVGDAMRTAFDPTTRG